MERRLQKISLFLIMMILLPVVAQEVSQERNVRFHVWASMEAYPGLERAEKDAYALPIRKIKEMTPLILSGMVYGWTFEYVPYDKVRGVKEIFDFSPINELTEDEISTIHYAKPWVKDSVLNCWVEFRRSDEQIHIYKGWESVLHPKIQGEGYAKLADGFDGLKAAFADALKMSVRNYERKWIKTKPKEISGRIFMREPPKIGIDAGRYKVTLDFFIETDKILEYKTF